MAKLIDLLKQYFVDSGHFCDMVGKYVLYVDNNFAIYVDNKCVDAQIRMSNGPFSIAHEDEYKCLKSYKTSFPDKTDPELLNKLKEFVDKYDKCEECMGKRLFLGR